MENDDRKPNSELRSILAHEDVIILSDKEIKNISSEKLSILVDYYSSTLEVLAGKQVWDIIDSLKSAQREQFIRKPKTLNQAI